MANEVNDKVERLLGKQAALTVVLGALLIRHPDRNSMAVLLEDMKEHTTALGLGSPLSDAALAAYQAAFTDLIKMVKD